MADTKISALTASTTPLAGTEVLPIVQSGTTKQVSVANLTAGRPISASAVGAGVASPATQLHAQGSNANLGTLELDSDPSVDFVGLTMWTKKTVPNANSRNWQVAANYQGFGTFDILNSTTTTGNPTTARFSMDNVGNATLNTGNLVIGTSGKGIDFSATAGTGTSELLADYEEGTWTPAAGANLAIIGTPTFTGEYTKIGNTVTAWGSVSSTTSVAYTAGGQILSGLPFTAQGIIAVGTVINNAFTFSSSIATLPTTAFLYGAEAIAATSAIYFQVTYHV
jgi:hypothetical protein